MNAKQIEKEGWELMYIYPEGDCVFQKGTKDDGYELVYSFKTKLISIARLDYFELDDRYRRLNLFFHSIHLFLGCTFF